MLGRDAQLSRGRWAIVLHFLRHNKSVVAAGADVRFLQPPSRIFEVCAGLGADTAFEGDLFVRSKRLGGPGGAPATPRVQVAKVGAFTPDVIVAMLRKLTTGSWDETTAGLPAAIERVPAVLVRGLVCEQ